MEHEKNPLAVRRSTVRDASAVETSGLRLFFSSGVADHGLRLGPYM